MLDPKIVKQQKENPGISLNLNDPTVAALDMQPSICGGQCIVGVHPVLVEGEEHIRYFEMVPHCLKTMITWLQEIGVTSIVMPNKGEHWEAVFLLLKESGFNLCLIAAKSFDKILEFWQNENSDSDSIFEMINPNAAGIDIGATEHWVCVPKDRDKESVRRFGAFTCDLHSIADWLKQCGVTTVAMESTGVYWIPLFQILEKEGFEVFLVNARHLKNIPGRRKTDNLDSRWIQKLHSFGLLAASFRPEDEICKVRSLIRHRDNLIRMKSKSIQYMQKSLDQMNIKITNVLSDITGVTGLRIIRAILSGERNFKAIARLKDYRVQATEEEILKSLEGDYRSEHLFTLQQSLELFEFYEAQILKCDLEIESLIIEMDKISEEKSGQMTFPFYTNTYPKKRKKHANDPSFDAQHLFLDLTGIDLVAIDGLGENTVQTILFEVGLDMNKWPTEKHFVSWLGLAPNPKISGGKNLGNQKRKVKNRAAQAFRIAASTLKFSKSSLGAFFRRIQARYGFTKAVTATARKLAIIFYTMLKCKTEYRKIDEATYLEKFKNQILKKIQRQAKALGYQVLPQN